MLLGFRRSNPSDRQGLVALVGRAMANPWSEAALSEAFDAPGIRIWLGERGERLAGFVVARRILDLLEIDLVGVDPLDRRMGLGRGLLRSLLEAEVAAGLGEARLELAASNSAARALYEGEGFVVVGQRTRYYPDGDDALLLTRILG